jgi:hypothetical protein
MFRATTTRVTPRNQQRGQILGVSNMICPFRVRLPAGGTTHERDAVFSHRSALQLDHGPIIVVGHSKF